MGGDCGVATHNHPPFTVLNECIAKPRIPAIALFYRIIFEQVLKRYILLDRKKPDRLIYCLFSRQGQ